MFQVISPAKYIPNCPAGKQCLFGVCFAAIAPEAHSKWIPVVIPRELVAEVNIRFGYIKIRPAINDHHMLYICDQDVVNLASLEPLTYRTDI
jgi:hypothetical protein